MPAGGGSTGLLPNVQCSQHHLDWPHPFKMRRQGWGLVLFEDLSVLSVLAWVGKLVNAQHVLVGKGVS